jgi:hypothetical protein
MTASPLFVIAVVAGIIAVLLFAVVFRMTSAMATSADGTIVGKTFRPTSAYTQAPVGLDRGMRTPTEIPIAESYVFEIRVDGMTPSLFYALNTVASRDFAVGQRVRVTYRSRGVPFAAKKYLVLDMQLAGSGALTPPAAR